MATKKQKNVVELGPRFRPVDVGLAILYASFRQIQPQQQGGCGDGGGFIQGFLDFEQEFGKKKREEAKKRGEDHTARKASVQQAFSTK